MGNGRKDRGVGAIDVINVEMKIKKRLKKVKKT